MSTLALGASASAQLTVRAEDLASAQTLAPGDHYPPVFATARMIALMEIAAARVLQPLLKPGELSVGAIVDVAHTAATPIGVEVVAEARFVAMEGKLFVFEVSAHDPGGEIGRGRHKRVIVTSERLVASAQRRCAAAG